MNTTLWIAGGVLLFLLFFWRPRNFGSSLPKQVDSNRPDPEGSSPAGDRASWPVVLLAIIAVWAVGVLFMENAKKVQKKNNEQRREEQVILLPPPAPEPRQHFIVEAPVGREIRIPIPMGFTCDTDPVEYGTNHVVWVRREGEERFKDWKGRPMGSSKKSWSNYKYLQSAGSVPVKVEVDIHPER